MMGLQLRNITAADVDLLYEWVNDAAVRKNSFNTQPIRYEEHQRWFNQCLTNPLVSIYVLCDGMNDIGQIRLVFSDNTATINYSIAQAFRGKGYGGAIIRLAEERIREDMPHIQLLIAEVKPENTASCAIFKRCNFVLSNDKMNEYLTYEKYLQ